MPIEFKNKIKVVIDNCQLCPHAVLLLDEDSGEEVMYCKQSRSLIWLRKNWGPRPIPNWCPRLSRKIKLCGKRAEIPGIIS